jgi:ubiquinol-cytochrome c reductase cytochrome c1 subunit
MRLLAWLLSALFYNFSWASQVQPLSVNVDVQDKASLQRGARFYMNYCSGCHALKYMRYNDMAKGLGLTTFSGEVDSDVLIQNLVFTQARVYDPIQISMPIAGAKQWFGIVPPDLSLIARSRGPNWVYTFLKLYYEDTTRPFHSNNLLFPDVGMPDVLYPLRGEVRRLSHASSANQLVTVKPGTMTAEEFDQALQDLINFLAYVGEPGREERKGLGIGVLVFLGVAFLLLNGLRKIVWKKLH